ncbi:MAG: twin-arginine translocase subunit TatC, partial [Myxococcota bacterium]
MSTQEAHDNIEESRAPFVEHLTELRNRIVIILIAVTVGFALSWTWIQEIFTFLLVPLQEAARDNKIDIDSAQMYHRSLTEHFFVLLKTGVYSGILLTIP